jgi:pSer/pThr/pTyr-binding forkhead associated (FHA) protein
MRKDVKIENPTNPSGPHFRARLPRVEIEILRGRARDLVREVTFPVFLIGTADDCDLVLGDARFSEVHAYLYVTKDGVSLRHLGGGPEVRVQGRPVHQAHLADGDWIRTGPYTFRVCIDGAPASGPGGRPTKMHRRDDVTTSVGIGRVEQLLNDIRGTLFGLSETLRVFDGSDRDSFVAVPPGSFHCDRRVSA